MVDDEDKPPPPTLDRVQAFSDGIFAIAITLLILPLTEAQIRDGHVIEDLLALQHQFLALGLSFAVIGRFWLLHHDDLTMMTSAGRRMLVGNLVFLFFIVLLPFPTALLGNGESATATIIYALVAHRDVAERPAALAVRRARRCDRRGARTAVGAREVLGYRRRRGRVPALDCRWRFVSPMWARVSWALVFPLGLLADRLEERPRRQERRRRPRRTTAQ